MKKIIFIVLLILLSGNESFTQPEEWTAEGKVSDEFGRGIGGLKIIVFDKDLTADDKLGTSATDENGNFAIRYKTSDFNDSAETSPELYVEVLNKEGKMIYNSRDNARYNSSRTEYFDIRIKTPANLKIKPITIKNNKYMQNLATDKSTREGENK